MQWNEFRFHIRHLSTNDQKVVQDAFDLGTKAHAPQRRLSGEPYFTHPIAVARILANIGADTDTIIAALLHDTVEDTALTFNEIVEKFNPTVGKLIDGVTKMIAGEIGEHPSLNQQIESLRKMFDLMQADVRIMVIKLADRLHNMQTISFRNPEKQKLVARETFDVYVKIADRLCMRDVRDDLENMCLAVLEPHLHPYFLELRKKNEERANVTIPHIRESLEKNFEGPLPVLQFEHKSWENLRKQHELELSNRNVTPSISLGVTCDTLDDCYRTLGMFHRIWRRETLSFQDFINAPVINGYKAIHTTVILEDGTRIRCKIRTKEMFDYAHKGIALSCFNSEVKGIFEYLPWTTRISPVSKDTKDRSADYWQSLQSDILGESILIHGEADQTELLPKGSTAMDGVFYTYGERGLMTKEIFVDGKPVSFYTPLSNAGTLTSTFAPLPQVQLKWLQFSKTGIGTALIHKGLAQQDHSVKKAIGQQLLQEYFSSRRRGFISEFDPAHIEKKLRKQGIPTIDELYIRLAEGRTSVQEIERFIFESETQELGSGEKHTYILTCTVPKTSASSMRDVLQYYTIKRYRTIEDNEVSEQYRMVMSLTDDEVRSFSFTLDHILNGQYKLSRSSAFYKMSFFSTLLFVLWGLDPAVAYVIMNRPGVTPVDMTIVRFLTLAAISGLFLLWIRLKQQLPETRLSLRNPSLWLSVICLFSVSLTTYYSLQNTLPSQYTIPMTSAGLLLTSLVNRKRLWTLLATWTIVALGVALLVFFTPGWDTKSILFTLLAVVSFTGFSIVSERYKRQEKVSLRAEQYFFMLSALCTALSMFLLPLSTLNDITPYDLMLMVLFSAFVSGLPYYIYYYLLSHKEIDFVLRYSFLIIPVSMAGQVLFISMPNVYAYLAALLVIGGACLPLANFKWASAGGSRELDVKQSPQ